MDSARSENGKPREGKAKSLATNLFSLANRHPPPTRTQASVTKGALFDGMLRKNGQARRAHSIL
jgi:hypothetical protein